MQFTNLLTVMNSVTNECNQVSLLSSKTLLFWSKTRLRLLFYCVFCTFLAKMTTKKKKIVIFAHENLAFYQQFDLRNIKMERTDINRLKVVLVEKKRTNKWLAEQLGRDPATVSKWCTNVAQPTLETLLQIAKLLEVEVQDLLVKPAQI